MMMTFKKFDRVIRVNDSEWSHEYGVKDGVYVVKDTNESGNLILFECPKGGAADCNSFKLADKQLTRLERILYGDTED
jgi:hypothetical protein